MRVLLLTASSIAALGLGFAMIGPAFAGPTAEQAMQEGLPTPATPSAGHWVFMPNNTTSNTANPSNGQAQDRATGNQQQQPQR